MQVFVVKKIVEKYKEVTFCLVHFKRYINVENEIVVLGISLVTYNFSNVQY